MFGPFKRLVVAGVAVGAADGCTSIRGPERPVPAPITSNIFAGAEGPLTDRVGFDGPRGPLKAPIIQPDKSFLLATAREFELTGPMTPAACLKNSPLPIISVERLLELESRGETMRPLGSSGCAVYVSAPQRFKNPNQNFDRALPIFIAGMPVGGHLGFLGNCKDVAACFGDFIFIINPQVQGIGGRAPLPIRTAVNGVGKIAAGHVDARLGEMRNPVVTDIGNFLHHFDQHGVKVTVVAHSMGAHLFTLASVRYPDIVADRTGKKATARDETLPMVSKVVFWGAGTALSPQTLGDRLNSYRFHRDPINSAVDFAAAAKGVVRPNAGEGLGYPHQNTENKGPYPSCRLFPSGIKRLECGGVEIVAPNGAHFTDIHADKMHGFEIAAACVGAVDEVDGLRRAATGFCDRVAAGIETPIIFERAMVAVLTEAHNDPRFAAAGREFARTILGRTPNWTLGKYAIPEEFREPLIVAARR